jgi:hypothetical protein
MVVRFVAFIRFVSFAIWRGSMPSTTLIIEQLRRKGPLAKLLKFRGRGLGEVFIPADAGYNRRYLPATAEEKKLPS